MPTTDRKILRKKISQADLDTRLRMYRRGRQHAQEGKNGTPTVNLTFGQSCSWLKGFVAGQKKG